jgi:hypothetical protein
MIELTDWFDGDTPPVHRGVYERQFWLDQSTREPSWVTLPLQQYSLFVPGAGGWFAGDKTPDDALWWQTGPASSFQTGGFRWRGRVNP